MMMMMMTMIRLPQGALPAEAPREGSQVRQPTCFIGKLDTCLQQRQKTHLSGAIFEAHPLSTGLLEAVVDPTT
eukprot:3253939-Alexandrium_andersonii.AAC.1